ncbi:MAG: YdcF family protein [Acidimicrobiales bacterium]
MFFFTVFRWFRRLIYIAVFAAVVYLVVTSAQVVVASRSTLAPAQANKASAIVVIGSATGPGPLSSDMKLRCEEAVALYRAGRAHTVIATGASAAPGAPSEAAASERCLRSFGLRHVTRVPLSEVPAQLGFVAGLIGPAGNRHVILVADPLQTKWLEDVASSEGLNAQVVAVPAPRGSFWADVGTIWDQAAAVALGHVIGYKNTGWIGA